MSLRNITSTEERVLVIESLFRVTKQMTIHCQSIYKCVMIGVERERESERERERERERLGRKRGRKMGRGEREREVHEGKGLSL